MLNKNNYGSFILFLTSLIWGSAFVAQKGSADLIGAFTFGGSRYFLSSLFLLIFIFIKDKIVIKKKVTSSYSWSDKNLIIGGLFCGIFLFVASSLQQIGIIYTTSGKAAFITTLYILIIPIISLFLSKKVSKKIWFAVFLGLIGLYLLAIAENGFTNINRGDIIEFIGSFFWAGHILIIDKYSKNVDTIKLSFIQFFIATILSFIVAIIFENIDFNAIKKTFYMIAYAGIISGGIGYTLQMVGQKFSTNPTISSLILSFEAVFGVLSGYLILGENLTKKELLGCIIMFIAVIIAQLPNKKEEL